MTSTSEFVITVLPARCPGQAKGLFLSLCIELRPCAEGPPPDLGAWYDAVQLFHGDRPGDTRSLYQRIKDQVKKKGSIVIGGVPYVGEVVLLSSGQAGEPVAEGAITLWNAVLPKRDPKTQPLSWKVAPEVEVAVSADPPLVGALTPKATPAAGGARDDHGGVPLTQAVRDMLATGSGSGLRTLTRSEREGIVRAGNNQTQANVPRLKAALATHRGVRVEDYHLPEVDSLDLLAAEVYEVLSAVSSGCVHSVKYVSHVFNALNGSPQMRRAFGTTIDIAVHCPADTPGCRPPSIEERAVEVSFTPGDLKDHIESRSSMMMRSRSHKNVMLAEPTDQTVLRDSVLQLGGARVMSAEPHSTAAAAEEVLLDLSRQSDEIRRAPVGSTETLRTLADFESRRQDGQPLNAADIDQLQQKWTVESRAMATLIRTDKRVKNTPTRGLVVYHPENNGLVHGLDTESDTPSPKDAKTDVTGAIRGFVIYVRRGTVKRRTPNCDDPLEMDKCSQWVPLTTVAESLLWLPAEAGSAVAQTSAPCDPCEFGIHVGGAVQQADESVPSDGSTTRKVKELRDGFVLAWDGTGLSARSPLRHKDRSEGASGKDEIRDALLAIERSHDLSDLEVLAALLKTGEQIKVEWLPYPRQQPQRHNLVVRRSYAASPTDRIKLAFADDWAYEFLAVPQYHNGYVPIDQDTVNDPAFEWTGRTTPESFLRHDHIRDIVVSFERDIYVDRMRDKKLRPENAGESETNLVVRTGELINTARCTRVLLPPPIPSFQTYLWYRKADLASMGAPRGGGQRHSRALTEAQLAEWYQRYSCDARTRDEFDQNLQRARDKNMLAAREIVPVRGCVAGCRSFCGGLTQPPVYDGDLRYLPDPVVTGLHVEFFHDLECRFNASGSGYRAQQCFYRNGRYPNVRGWRLVLEKYGRPTNPDTCEGDTKIRSKVKIADGSQTLTVLVPEGRTLYARVTPMHQPNRSHFACSLIDEHFPNIADAIRGQTKERDVDLPDLLHGNATVFTLTHATQRPLVTPHIDKGRVRRFNPTLRIVQNPGVGSTDPQTPKTEPNPAMLELDVDVTLEWLNIVNGIAQEDMAPTGDLDLFALWETYDDRHDGPLNPIGQPGDHGPPPGRFVQIARLTRDDFQAMSQKLAKTCVMNGEATCQTVRMTFRSDHAPFATAQHAAITFLVRNSSSFYNYFHGGGQMSTQDIELHSRWSNELLVDGPVTGMCQNDKRIEAGFLPSNIKPSRPVVEKIVALVTRDEAYRSATIRYRGNRVRVYLNREGRQKTGPERIGIAVAAKGATEQSLGLFANAISEFGQDIVTDGPAEGKAARSWVDWEAFGVLRCESIPSPRTAKLEDEYPFEEEYIERFSPCWEPQLFEAEDAPGVDLVSYRPRYDAMQELWYFDVELDLTTAAKRELHNPFVRLSLLTYQPRGANYGPPKADNNRDLTRSPFELDYRVSDVQLTEYFSIYPSRLVGNPLVLFGRGGGKCTLSGAKASLFFRQIGNNEPVLRTQFVAEVQRRDDGDIWRTINSTIKIDGNAAAQCRPDMLSARSAGVTRHLLLNGDLQRGKPDDRFECSFTVDFDPGGFGSRGSGRFRVLIREIEWFPFEERASGVGTTTGVTWEAICTSLQTADVAQVPDLRTRQIMLLTPP